MPEHTTPEPEGSNVPLLLKKGRWQSFQSRALSLGTHDEAFSKLDILVNPSFLPSEALLAGTRLQIRLAGTTSAGTSRGYKQGPENGRSETQEPLEDGSGAFHCPTYVFYYQEVPSELLVKHPNLEVSVSQNIASALGFQRSCSVFVSKVKETRSTATHVEITFKNAYLTRADMWRLIISQLSGRSMYRGQKLTFLNTIRAQVSAIYRNGRRMQAAFFGNPTKPIFRSESARSVIFIQMSKEMWEFDADGTGEIMFHKVINGFLPELFRKWEEAGVSHLISIILFTRIEYDEPVEYDSGLQDKINDKQGQSPAPKDSHRDFYRVLISNMPSGNWASTLAKLKKEFKVFLSNVTITSGSFIKRNVFGTKSLLQNSRVQQDIVLGRPTSSTQGNILEAINLASSQYAGDNIDRDLIRTGISIVIVSPGSGVFEVDYSLLQSTAEALTSNAIGIDLVCLSKMPLHSVPLFKYMMTGNSDTSSGSTIQNIGTTFRQSERDNGSSRLTSPSISSSSIQKEDSRLSEESVDSSRPWHFGIPEWLDVSFWEPSSDSGSETSGDLVASRQSSQHGSAFAPRVRMYEVQMMGVMQNEMSEIKIPELFEPLRSFGFTNAKDLITRERAPDLRDRLRNQSSHKPPNLPGYGSASLSRSLAENDRANLVNVLSSWMDRHDSYVSYTTRQESPGSIYQQLAKDEWLESNQKRLASAVRKAHAPDTTTWRKQQGIGHNMMTSKGLEASASLKLKPNQSSSGLSRQISSGFRSFGRAVPKAIAVTEISAETAHPQASLLVGSRYQTETARSIGSRSDALGPLSSADAKSSQHILPAGSNMLDSSTLERNAMPIAIRQPSSERSRSSPALELITNSANPKKISERPFSSGLAVERQRGSMEPKALSFHPPWYAVYNPSKPRKTSLEVSRRPSRWRYVYSRPMNASQTKWKSLCSPASLPITTEYYSLEPSLALQDDALAYIVKPVTEKDMTGKNLASNWLLKELISARLNRGFQIVTGFPQSDAFSDLRSNALNVFDELYFDLNNGRLLMTSGNEDHYLYSVGDNTVRVRISFRNEATSQPDQGQGACLQNYRHSVLTPLGDHYEIREVNLKFAKERLNWEKLDTFISGREERLFDGIPGGLHSYRARYVLIPAQHSKADKGNFAENGDSEEEIRLEGIRKLSQLWQKHRLLRREDSLKEPALKAHKDPNPLEIIYRTRNPAAVVASEPEVSIITKSVMRESAYAELPLETELFERSNFEMQSLARALQSERGVKMTDRRWHWTVHRDCFIGLDLTTWLLNNFRDIYSREEATEFGNELMKKKLFTHVQKRHAFRDGNFFYRISEDYHTPRNESRNNWLSRITSVPSTPIPENFSELDNQRLRIGENNFADTTAKLNDPRIPTVLLSKSLVFDVDYRKRSDRSELIVLHYDCISSADDCYHLRIDWLTASPKLVEDSVASWANMAERSGLRFVKLPIKEISREIINRTFDALSIIKLALKPPEKARFGEPRADHFYQKAILRRFGFVLDLEAAKDFSPPADVTYSWGRPDYAYPQYVSRDGSVLVQISDEGNFLLMANNLVHTRPPAARDALRSSTGAGSDVVTNKGDGLSASILAHLPQAISPNDSPMQSPIVRASSGPSVGTGSEVIPPPPERMSPEQIKHQLESFCSNRNLLSKLYQEEDEINKLLRDDGALGEPSSQPGRPGSAIELSPSIVSGV